FSIEGPLVIFGHFGCCHPTISKCRSHLRPPARNRDQGCAARSHLPLDQHLLDLGDGLGGVEALRAGRGAIQDGVAAVEPERGFEIVEPLAGCLVAAVHDRTVRLQQDGRPEEALAVPPIAWDSWSCSRSRGCSSPGPPAWP